MNRLRVTALVACAFGLSCTEQKTARPSDTQAALGGSVAARVGDEAIPLSVVQAVAEAQRLTPKDALRRLVDDEIAANAARKAGLDAKPPTSWNLKSVRARIVSDRLHAAALEAGTPTDAEVKRLSEVHWAEVDKPPMVHVMHVIAIRRKDGAKLAETKKVGEALLAAVKDTTSKPDFEKAAKAVSHPKDIDVRVEDLPAFTKEGLVVGGGGMNADFAAAAFALPAAGAISGLVETSFGWHVIRLIERLPERRMPFDDRRKAFAEEAIAMRSRDAVTLLMSELTAKTKVEISPAAASLMQSVPITTEPQAANP